MEAWEWIAWGWVGFHHRHVVVLGYGLDSDTFLFSFHALACLLACLHMMVVDPIPKLAHTPSIFPSGTFEAHRNILAEHDLAQHSMVD